MIFNYTSQGTAYVLALMFSTFKTKYYSDIVYSYD